MQALTVTLAVILACLVVLIPRAHAFSVYVITLLFYPVYLVVQLGSLDVSAARVVVMVLLLRCLLNIRFRASFKWNWLDRWVTFAAVTNLCIALIGWKMPMSNALQNESGHITDTYFAYLVVRFCLTDYRAIVTSIKWIAIALIPLAILGVIESYTGWAPYYNLVVYCPWLQIVEPALSERTGFYRAIGPFNHPIMFGAAFIMFLPLVYWLRHQTGHWRIWSYVTVAFLAIGAFSSMSSGPVMMLFISIGFLAVERAKYLLKPLIICAVSGCFIIGIISNRPFYHVIASYADPLGGSGWHRAALIDLAIKHFNEWWFLGYGGQDPHWGKSLGMSWTDITNNYIVAGVKYGLVGIITLCGILTVGIRTLIQLHNSTKTPLLKSWYWALGAIFVTLVISFNSFCLFGQAETLFYCILGFVGSSFNISSRTVLV
jgi:hypothetical protein